MIAPLTPFAIQGFIWYQGENTSLLAAYQIRLPGMIRDWREAWKLGDFPFLLVQLPPFSNVSPASDWAAVREAQTLPTTVLPRVGIVVTTDVGEETDIHPNRKQPVGERLARLARRIAYNQKIVASGPTFRSMRVVGNRAILTFDNVGAGLDARGGKLTGFAIAGDDHKFVPADAAIVGRIVVVTSPVVPHPAAVRFGWANYPIVNLWNKDGLPAVPFRTDGPAE